MLALCILPYYYYGLRAWFVVAISVAASVLSEYICTSLIRRKYDWRDPSPVANGIMLALLMPASVPYGVMIFASAFMGSVMKYPFGGHHNRIFHPVATAYLFSALCWPSSVLRYPTPSIFGSLSLSSSIGDALDRSFTHYVDVSVSSSSWLDILWGRLSGPMGTSCVILILICTIALYCFRDIPAPVLFSSVATEVLLFTCFPISATGWQAALYSIATGSFMYVLAFMVCDPCFTPSNGFGQTLYGIAYALTAFLLRKFSGYEDSSVLALMIVSIFPTEFDRFAIFVIDSLSRFGDYLVTTIRERQIYRRFRKYENLPDSTEPESVEEPQEKDGDQDET
ncbi:MAG: RnfABCDGE type electron transport complex subunit D [Oscillospiraceae bacterium]|nr:RnfABCDGE type electron transport complex subunit D [Oscillospiraceae bacterium]